MKKLLAIALCAFFAFHAAEGRTIYVNSSRPNNKGNGLKAKTAKKTIQAAINIAKKGDTILVYPGHYTRISSNNKKIKIKSTKGEAKTVILSGVDKKGGSGFIVADLVAWSKNVTAYHPFWKTTWNICWQPKGSTATTIQGFKIRPTSFNNAEGDLWYFETAAAIAGGTAKNCSFEHCGNVWRYLAFNAGGRLECTAAWPTFLKTKLVDCRIIDCNGKEEWYKRNGNYDSVAATLSSGVIVDDSSFSRCAITQSGCSFSGTRNGGLPESCNFRNSTFSNCLFARNWRPGFKSCIFGNCTVAGNYSTKLSGCKAYNTVFHGVSKSQFAKKNKNSLSGCYKGTSPKFLLTPVSHKWNDDGQGEFVGENGWKWDSSAKLWVMLDAIDADYRLQKDSPCIDKGLRGKAARKLYGSKDLNGKKRVVGKTIDIGCYEYSANQKGSVRFMNDMVVNMSDHGVCGWSEWALSSLKNCSDSETYGTLPTPECDGEFVFAGWWTDPIGGEQVFASSPVSCRRLYAHWVELHMDYYGSNVQRKDVCDLVVNAFAAFRPYQDGSGEESYQSIGNFALTIPESFDGQRVVTVGFGESVIAKVTSITIPSSVSYLYLGWEGFTNFHSLKTIRLQNGSPLVPGTDFEVPAGCAIVRY